MSLFLRPRRMESWRPALLWKHGYAAPGGRSLVDIELAAYNAVKLERYDLFWRDGLYKFFRLRDIGILFMEGES